MKNDNLPISAITAIILCIITFAGYIIWQNFYNGTTEEQWNNGVCPQDNCNYELRGVNYSVKYYVCPECHIEIQRY